MATVYVETSIIGYLTARSGDSIIFQLRQQLTRSWWATRHLYELVTSQLVLEEAGSGDSAAAQERLELLEPIPLLDIEHPEVQPLARTTGQSTSFARKSKRGRETRGRFDSVRCRLLVDMELQAHCQRRNATEDLRFVEIAALIHR